MPYGVGKAPGHGGDRRAAGARPRQEVMPNLAAGLDNHAQIGFAVQVAVDDVAEGHPLGDGTVAVAELPVIECLENRAHGVVTDGKGIYHGIGGLYFFPEEGIKSVLIDALALPGAVEAPQAAALEGILRNVDQPGAVRIDRLEVSDHVPQIFIARLEVGDNDRVNRIHLRFRGRQRGRIVRRRRRGTGWRGFADVVGNAPERVFKKCLRVLPALFSGQVIHIGGQAVNHLHPQVVAVVLNIPVGGHIIKMLGGSDLRHKFPRKVRAAGL